MLALGRELSLGPEPRALMHDRAKPTDCIPPERPTWMGDGREQGPHWGFSMPSFEWNFNASLSDPALRVLLSPQGPDATRRDASGINHGSQVTNAPVKPGRRQSTVHLWH